MKIIMKWKTLLAVLMLFFVDILYSQTVVWVETEQFQNKGGWIIESQFIDLVGSSYLLAHGLGEPVEDAKTKVIFPKAGKYHFWVRTKDWLLEGQGEGPGKFNVLINGVKHGPDFGSDRINGWHWVYGGETFINTEEVEISLKDLSGFDGRCDLICFSEKKMKLPDDTKEIDVLRNKYIKIDTIPSSGKKYDLVVGGGGVAGMCAAIQAARLGLSVALISNRPVLGGNSSSEVKVSTTGTTFVNRYPNIGRITRELDNQEAGMGGDIKGYKDEYRKDIIKNEKNIDLYEGMHIFDVSVSNSQIKGVFIKNIYTLDVAFIEGELFVDCTGDASLGILSGADYYYGREDMLAYNEPSAPYIADSLVMGSSNQWRASFQQDISYFEVQPWMFKFTEDYFFPMTSSSWNWESGFNNFHTVYEAEEIRDLNMLAIYSNWAFLKTYKQKEFGNYKLIDLSTVVGKRESFRLRGDHVLTENDVVNKIEYSDAVVTTNWGIDIHYPDPENSKRFPGMEFVAYADHKYKEEDIYTFPYRCLYSRNINNLFMAGRNISVTHIALGTVRVQRCTGMMGEVVGIAAFFCKLNNCSPRDVYKVYLDDFLHYIKNGCHNHYK